MVSIQQPVVIPAVVPVAPDFTDPETDAEVDALVAEILDIFACLGLLGRPGQLQSTTLDGHATACAIGAYWMRHPVYPAGFARGRIMEGFDITSAEVLGTPGDWSGLKERCIEQDPRSYAVGERVARALHAQQRLVP